MWAITAAILTAIPVGLLAWLCLRPGPGQHKAPRGEHGEQMPSRDFRDAFGHDSYAWGRDPATMPYKQPPIALPPTLPPSPRLAAPAPPRAVPDVPGDHDTGCRICGDPGHEAPGHDAITSILSPPSFRDELGETYTWVTEHMHHHPTADDAVESIFMRVVKAGDSDA